MFGGRVERKLLQIWQKSEEFLMPTSIRIPVPIQDIQAEVLHMFAEVRIASQSPAVGFRHKTRWKLARPRGGIAAV